MTDPRSSSPSLPRPPSVVISLMLLAAIGGLMQAATSFAGTATSLPGSTELAFGFLLLSSYFTAKIANRLGLPKLTGYLIAGVVAGPSVLALISDVMLDKHAATGLALKVVSDAATAILALEAGAELDLKKVRPVARTLRGITLYAVIGSMITIGAAMFLLQPLLPGLFGGMSMQQRLVVCMVVGVALSSQSPAVAMAMLAETRAEGPLSRVILASVVAADLTVIVVFSLALAVAGALIGGEIDVQATALEVGWELLGSILFGIAIGMLVGLFLRTVKEGAALFALMVCVVVAEIGPHVHLDPLIVLLASGVWLRNFSTANAHDLLSKFESAQLPVFLVFFALAGANLQLDKLAANAIAVVVIAVVRAATFYFGSRRACRRANADPMTSRYAWFGLVPQAGLALALAIVLQDTFSAAVYGAGNPAAFGDNAAVLVLGVVALNQLVAPPILRIVLMRSGEAGKKQNVDFAAGGH
jgi:Kef-type K+ transport system membrane component KefB|nr:cation:proton antiporter [Kofleriaceae bacterium]